MRNLLRAAAEALGNLAEKAHAWADRADDWASGLQPDGAAAPAFAGVDLVGIDFSTSIQRVANHVIHGWDRYRRQVAGLRRDHGIWVFGVNALPFPLTPRPLLPHQLPDLSIEHFCPRGHGRGLVEYGSAFYDYFFMALGRAEELGWIDAGYPVTVSLLCDGLPNGGVYRAGDVRPLLDEARGCGVRFKVAAFALFKYRHAMLQFRESLGLTPEELEIAWYDTGGPDEKTIHGSFASLSHF
jgi:hypothetical protein